MLVNERQREVHVHKVNGLELRKRIVRASENIHWSIPYTHTHTHTRTHIHISSIHIQAPFYLWPFILRTKYIDHVWLSRWIFTSCISVSERFFSLFSVLLLLVSATKNLPILKFMERNTLDFILFVHLFLCYMYILFVLLLLFKCFSLKFVLVLPFVRVTSSLTCIYSHYPSVCLF